MMIGYQVTLIYDSYFQNLFLAFCKNFMLLIVSGKNFPKLKYTMLCIELLILVLIIFGLNIANDLPQPKIAPQDILLHA